MHYCQPSTAYGYPGSPGGGEPHVDYGDPNYERGGDPSYGRGIERVHPHAVDALEGHEARLADKFASGRMSGGRDTNTRLGYGDPSVESTEAQLDAAHERLESHVAELRAKGVTGPELDEAERLLQGFHSSESAYDAMASKVESRASHGGRARSEKDKDGNH